MIFPLKIADFSIEIDFYEPKLQRFFGGYLQEKQSENADVRVYLTDELIDKEKKLTTEKNAGRAACAFSAVHRMVAEWLPAQDAFVLHSATFDVDGVGVAFGASSGTGKTTHLRLWQQYLGDRLTIVNGDKPIVRFFPEDPTPYAYGSPWMGKEKYGKNMRTPLKHICFIERSENNFVVPLTKEEAVNRMINQVYMPQNPAGIIKTMELIDRLLSSCQLWQIHCNMDPSAAVTAYTEIFGS